MGYYFISIGGSGARVMESLAHLCAAGLLPNANRQGHLYTMAIDPDKDNGNLVRANQVLNCLDAFQNVNVEENTPLLKTPLKLANPFIWSPTPRGSTLDQIINYPGISGTPVGRLYEALYTDKERATVLDVGFRGRPSIGAAVMGLKATANNTANAWGHLINTVRSDVGAAQTAKIFLAGSIFGGTGAAGLPTIANLLREIFSMQVRSGMVRIGGALLLPYFSFSPTDGQKVHSGIFASADNFLTNTKAALRYYADTGGSDYDSMYFVGDDTMKEMPEFSVGSSTQCNDAHIVDLFAAMAAVHFYRGSSGKHCYYISRNLNTEFQWNDFPKMEMEDGANVPKEERSVSVQERFVQFTRFIFAYLHIVKPVLQGLASGNIPDRDHPWYGDYWKDKIDITSDEVRNFEQYAEDFVAWLDQVERSGGPRAVKLIDPNSFRIESGQAKINPDLFPTLDYGNSKLTMDEVQIRRLARGESGGGVISNIGSNIRRVLGNGNKNTVDTKRYFGLFLRRLYDDCKA